MCIHHLSDYFGILSWRMPTKTGVWYVHVLNVIEQAAEKADYYYVPLPGHESSMDIWEHGEKCHPGIIELGREVCRRASLPLTVGGKIGTPAFCMYVVFKSDIYEQYVEKCLIPAMRAMDLMDESSKPGGGLWRELPYNNSSMSKEELIALFGRPAYSYHTVVLERLLPTWLDANGLIGQQISPKRPDAA